MRVEDCLATPKALDSGGVEKKNAKAAVGKRIVVGGLYFLGKMRAVEVKEKMR